MENAVVQQIRKKITRSKFGEIFFVSSFPQYDVEYVTKLLAIFEKEGLVTRIAKGVYVKARKTRFGILYPSAYELVTEIAKRLGLTTLKFARLEDLVESIGMPKCRVCTHCFDGSSYCHEYDNEDERQLKLDF